MPARTPLSLAALALCASLPWGAAFAQEAAPADETAETAQTAPDAATAEAVAALPAVTVTATGYETPAVETPVGTTELDLHGLQQRQAANVGEALRGEPGLAASGDSAQGQNVVIRGLKKEGVVLLVDGVRLNSAQPVGAVSSFMTLGLAEKVEVVKGPSSVLYGTGALGGAINVRLPQARFVPGVQWRTGLGFDSASKGVHGALVMNAGSERHAFMGGVALRDASDYRSGSGKVPRTGYDSRAFIGQYRYRIDADQQLRFSAQQQRDDDVWYPGTTQPHPLPVVGSTTIHSPRTERRMVEAGYTRARSSTSPVGVDVRLWRQEMHRTIYGFGNRLGRDVNTSAVKFKTDGLDAKGEWLAHPQHLLSFGLNLWQMKASPNTVQYAPPAFTQAMANSPFRNGKIRASGVYLQDDMQFDKLRVLAGVRYDRVRGSADWLNSGRVTEGINRSDSAVSGSLGLMYEVHPLLRPYVNVARGFRAADMRERFQSGLRFDGSYYAGNPQLAPEKATQFELGIKGASQDVEYAASIYRNRISNYITGQPLEGQTAIAACGQQQAAICRRNVNLGSVTIKGFEAGARWQVKSGHWLTGAYTRIRGDNNDLHEPLYQMPADTLSVGWEGRVAPGWTLDAHVRATARQKRVATVFSRGTEDATSGYTLIDIGATWQPRAGQSLRFAIRNLTDRTYHDHLAVGRPGFEVKAPGRSFAISWNAEF